MFVNAAEPEPRHRFTIAHELGRWVCQCLEGTAATVMALEREANIFAAELLMPEDQARTQIGTDDLARRSEVSGEAMTWRRLQASSSVRRRSNHAN